MKKAVLSFIFITLFFGPSFTQTILKKTIKPTLLNVPKVLVHGSVTYRGTVNRISATISFRYKNRALKNLKVRVNNLVLKKGSPGDYQLNSLLKTRVKVGSTIVITAESKDRQAPFTGKVIVATYKVKNYVKLIFPKQLTILLSAQLRSTRFFWGCCGFHGWGGRL